MHCLSTEVLTASSVSFSARCWWEKMASLLKIENAKVLIGRVAALLFVALRNPRFRGFWLSKQTEIGESIRGHENFSSGEWDSVWAHAERPAFTWQKSATCEIKGFKHCFVPFRQSMKLKEQCNYHYRCFGLLNRLMCVCSPVWFNR